MNGLLEIHLARPEWLIAIPVFLLLMIFFIFKTKQALPPIGQWLNSFAREVYRHPLAASLIQKSTQNKSIQSRSRYLSLLNYSLLLTLLFISLSQPYQIGKQLPDPPLNRDIVFLVDTSVSMILKDYIVNGVRTDRLTVMKNVFAHFIEQLKGNRIQIIAYSENAYTLVPLTTDYQLLNIQLQRLDAASLTGRSSDLSKALLYALHSRGCTHPVNDLRLFRIRSFTIAVMGSLLTRLGVAGLSFLLVLYLQIGCGYSPLAAGLMLAPLALAMMLMKPFIEQLIRQFGYRLLLRITTPLVGVILASFALLGTSPSPWEVGVLVFIYGLVLSLQYTTMNTLSFTDLAPAQAAHAAALTTTVQYLALSFGIANASMLMAIFVGPTQQPAAYVPAFRLAVLLLGLFPLVATLVFLRLRHDRPIRTPIETPDTAA